MNKKLLISIPLVIGLVIVFWSISKNNMNQMKNAPENNTPVIGDETPIEGPIKLSVNKDFEYEPRQINVKLGSDVRIEADTTTLVEGMDTVIIEGYGIRKLIAPNDNIIEFKADKPGTYNIYCGNGMGNGKLVVK